MQPGYTTGNGLGLGLPGAKRLMDEMEIESEAAKGTKITVTKWRKGT
jgi:serine/threonine-protein kinase RsbT